MDPVEKSEHWGSYLAGHSNRDRGRDLAGGDMGLTDRDAHHIGCGASESKGTLHWEALFPYRMATCGAADGHGCEWGAPHATELLSSVCLRSQVGGTQRTPRERAWVAPNGLCVMFMYVYCDADPCRVWRAPARRRVLERAVQRGAPRRGDEGLA